jgi:hypothetical protein
MFDSNEINITDRLTGIIREITRFSESFKHIDTERILVCTASNRSRSRGGTYGKLVPLKFKDGSPFMEYRNRVYTIPEIVLDDVKLLYIIYFYMPRFYDLNPLEKLNVIFHELYHISPSFNGDIRRMGKKKPPMVIQGITSTVSLKKR